jgi:hypothetical protein
VGWFLSSKNVSKAEMCSFYVDVVCLFKLDLLRRGLIKRGQKVYVLDQCFTCKHHKKFVEEMEREEDEFFAEVDARDREEGVICRCDGKLCDRQPVGSCFSVFPNPDGSPSDILSDVCSRFKVDCFPDGSLTKETFLRLRKREVV